MNTTDYPVFVIWSEQDQAFLARVVDLPGCMADGKTRKEAIENIQISIEEWLDTAKEMGWTVPSPQDDTTLEASTLKNSAEQVQRFQQAVQVEVSKALEQLIPHIAERLLTQFQPSAMPTVGTPGYIRSRFLSHHEPSLTGSTV